MKPQFLIAKYKSWKDLNKHLETLTKSKRAKEAGDIFENLVKLYLQTEPQYQSKLKKVYLLNEVPESLKRKLRLPSTDEGIDLIVETYDKTYWSIQAKYRSDSKQTLTRGDLSTFSDLSFNYCKNIEHGLVCTTVDKPPRKVKLMDNIGFDTIECFYRLDDNGGEEWKAILAKCKGKAVKPKPFKPRPHQKKALKETASFLKNNDRGKILMPCGTGKSITAFWIAQNLKAKSILVAVPSLALLQQTLRVWTREYLIHGIRPEWLCVCSDDTVKEDQDDYVTNSADIGVKVTTDQSEIKSFLKKRSQNIKVVFTTYQSGQVTAKGAKGFTFDLGIMDEAHKTVGHRDKPMAHLIHNKNIKVKKRVFMTATERLFRGDQDEYVSMDDPRDYGDTIYQLSFKAAIDMTTPIISDYKVITFNVNEPDIEALYKDNKFIQVQKKIKNITAREFATAIALRKAIKKLKIKNAVSFHSSIKRADNFSGQQDLISEVYKDYGKLKTFHVSGKMPTNERASQMREFAEGRGLMTNARCLTEGVDLPAIDCVVFTDPKRSRVDIVQAAGRALRLSKGKKFGYILLPLIVPKNESASKAAEDTGFEEVVTTLKALASQDSRIVDYLRAVSSGSKPKGGSPVDGLLKINTLSKINEEEFKEAITLKVWDRLAFGNWVSYEDAKKFAKKNNIKSFSQWVSFTKLDHFPLDIPKSPLAYKEFTTWGEFLGTGSVQSGSINYPSIDELKKIVRKYKIQSIVRYKEFSKSKKAILLKLPAHPPQTHKNKGWNGWSDFLGNKTAKPNAYMTYDEAEKYMKKFRLNNYDEYKTFLKSDDRPITIPYHPERTYKNKGWISYAKFLGYKNKSWNKSVVYLDYDKAKIKLQKLNFKKVRDYYKYAKNISDLPVAADRIYKSKGWVSWADFLNTNLRSRKLENIKLKELEDFVKKNKVNSRSEYEKLWSNGNVPLHFPSLSVLDKFFRIKKTSFNQFFQIENPKKRSSKDFKSLNKLKEFMKKNYPQIQTGGQYIKYWSQNERPIGITISPERLKGWKGWDDFFYRRKKTIFDYKKAKSIIKKYNIKSGRHYYEFIKDSNIYGLPKIPDIAYKKRKEWKGWPDFLGTNSK